MKFLRSLFGVKRQTRGPISEVSCAATLGQGNAAYIELYYSTLMDTRPHVMAMREVAADSMRPAV